MNTLLKAGCLAIYLLAVIGAFIALPFGATSALQTVAAILLGLHVLELLVAFKSIRRYPGPLIDSIGLTLLFGLLHWLPLAKDPKAGKTCQAAE
jgi:hypothetical protein